MNYRIFQPFYKKGQYETLDPEFTPYDNMKNERPELREYHIFKSAMENGTVDKLNAWGFFSTRWKAKTKIKPKNFIDWVERNPGYDVYFINHSIIQEAVTINVWEQGDWYHPNITDATQTVLNSMGSDINLKKTIMTTKTYCFCSYFVGSKSFWTDYMQFLNEFVRHIDLVDDKTKSIINNNANYGKDMSLNYFPFIIERLFPTYLSANIKRYKILNFPNQYQVYRPYMRSLVELVESLSLMKKMSVQLDNPELFNSWLNTRDVFFKKYAQAMNYEQEEYYDPDFDLDKK